MKQSKIKTLLLLMCFTGMAVSAFAVKEKTVTQTRDVQPFSKISVSAGIDLYLTQGNREEVIVEADADVIDKLITEVSNGKLKIYMKQNNNGWKWKSDQVRKVRVSFSDLTELSASSGSDVSSQGSFNLKELAIDCSSGADVDIDDLTAEFVKVSTSSGSDAKVSGKTNRLRADSSSGSDLDCGRLVSANCDVSVSSGSDATVNVTESLKADASSGGDIEYYGNPKQKTISKSSGGGVKAK